MYAPIVLFAFNRLDVLKRTVDSLLTNKEARDTDLYVFVDGPRLNRIGEVDLVNEVKAYVKGITGFNSISLNFSDVNKGLGPSIIAGVSDVIKKHGKAIVVEDDLYCASNFLSFMNQGLEKYVDEPKVFSICGYSNKVRIPKNYSADAYFCVRSSSWGWATWADRWNSVDWNLENWELCKKNARLFNKWGGSDCFGMLKGWKEGRNKSWAIRFCYAQFIQDKLSVFPIRSKVSNEGFDGSGTNCKGWSRFKEEFDYSGSITFVWPSEICINRIILKSVLSYHSIYMRIFSRIMYVIKK